MVDLGVDYSSNFIFQDGDIILVDDEDNLIESIYNRLNTRFDSMQDYYYVYGSFLHLFLGKRNTESTLEAIQVEVEMALQQDPRILNYDVEVIQAEIGVIINLNIQYGEEEDEELTTSLIMNEDVGVDISGS